jgi:hypothetical protein
MEQKQIEVYSEMSNYAIVRMPGRNYPGCVIQGDSLNILLKTAKRAHELAVSTGIEDLIGETEDLVENLSGRLDYYEVILKAHGMDVPYHRPKPTN